MISNIFISLAIPHPNLRYFSGGLYKICNPIRYAKSFFVSANQPLNFQ